ncbi:hypothetical protein HMI56_000762 [Coelomomyces lativittatus]|nr:hypothetical protein HMI56_000762 [Coelomomyces lativittatus]
MIQDPQPSMKLLSFPPYHRVGLLHGDHWVPHDDLEMVLHWALQANVNVVISSHPSSQAQVTLLHDILILSPGSITLNEPSFLILQIEDRDIQVYVYHDVEGEVKINKKNYTLPEEKEPLTKRQIKSVLTIFLMVTSIFIFS